MRELQRKLRMITSCTPSFFARRNTRNDNIVIKLLPCTIAFLLLFVLCGIHKRNVYEICSSASGPVYDVTIDAGSTGTRIHVYNFVKVKKELRLLSEFVQRVKPGLSSYFTNTEEISKSLQSLLQSAVTEVPQKYHRCTAITLKATAGLRLLSQENQTRILSMANKLIDETPFLNRGASVISGKEEGVYGWLTINFLLGRLQTAHASSAVTVDMGGGSAQIVFATDESSELWLPLAYTSRFRIDGKRVTLYQHSYLGFGLVEAKNRMLTSDQGESIRSACVPSSIQDDNEALPNNETQTKAVQQNFSKCVELQKEHLFNVSKINCAFASCAIQGTPQPCLSQTKSDVYVYSYFYDHLKNIDGDKSRVFVRSYKEAGKKACSRSQTQQQNEFTYVCMELAYLYTFLRYGMGLPDDRLLHVENSIQGKAVAWTLGASLAYLFDIDV